MGAAILSNLNPGTAIITLHRFEPVPTVWAPGVISGDQPVAFRAVRSQIGNQPAGWRRINTQHPFRRAYQGKVAPAKTRHAVILTAQRFTAIRADLPIRGNSFAAMPTMTCRFIHTVCVGLL
jgi:hypothetical protein